MLDSCKKFVIIHRSNIDSCCRCDHHEHISMMHVAGLSTQSFLGGTTQTGFEINYFEFESTVKMFEMLWFLLSRLEASAKFKT